MSVKMVLGSYTFDLNPKIDFDILKPKKKCSFKETFTSVAYFSWGSSIIGKEIEIKWDWMSIEQYEAIQAIYVADNVIVFDPCGTTGIKFNVNVTAFDGVYFLRMVKAGTEESYYKEVVLKLLIMSEVS